MEIPSASEVSVVVQGPIVGGGVTEKCLASIRKNLPGAEIILSTWVGSLVSGLDYDLLVDNQDPGPIWITDAHWPSPYINNVNRQIVSTLGGLRLVTRKYTLKIRTDFLLQGDGFLKYFGQYHKRSPSFKFFEERILACTVHARNPRRVYPRHSHLFHPGDFIFFGLTPDMLKLWDVNPAAYTVTDLSSAERANLGKEHTRFTRLYPEQCIWTGCLAQFPEVRLPHLFYSDCGQLLAVSEESLVNNLVFLQPEMWPVLWLKERAVGDIRDWMAHYTHAEWCALYRKYCDPAAPVPFCLSTLARKIVWTLWLARRPTLQKFQFQLLQPFYRRLVKWK